MDSLYNSVKRVNELFYPYSWFFFGNFGFPQMGTLTASVGLNWPYNWRNCVFQVVASYRRDENYRTYLQAIIAFFLVSKSVVSFFVFATCSDNA